MKLVATAIAALALMAAPLAAQEAAQAPQARTAGVAQQAEFGQAEIMGIPPVVFGIGLAAIVGISAVALSNSDNDTPSTTGTR